MCRVLNKHHAGIPAGAVYIGRGGKWGNPFRIGRDGDRATVITKYERSLADQHHLLRALDELRGHDLVCFSAPLACHGDLLRRLANATRDERIVWWRAVKVAA
jgi:prephenate dehydrogenase